MLPNRSQILKAIYISRTKMRERESVQEDYNSSKVHFCWERRFEKCILTAVAPIFSSLVNLPLQVTLISCPPQHTNLKSTKMSICLLASKCIPYNKILYSGLKYDKRYTFKVECHVKTNHKGSFFLLFLWPEGVHTSRVFSYLQGIESCSQPCGICLSLPLGHGQAHGSFLVQLEAYHLLAFMHKTFISM